MSIINHRTCTDYEWNGRYVRLYHGGDRQGYIEVSWDIGSSIGLTPLLLHHPANMTSDQRRKLSCHLRFALR